MYSSFSALHRRSTNALLFIYNTHGFRLETFVYHDTTRRGTSVDFVQAPQSQANIQTQKFTKYCAVPFCTTIWYVTNKCNRMFRASPPHRSILQNVESAASRAWGLRLRTRCHDKLRRAKVVCFVRETTQKVKSVSLVLLYLHVEHEVLDWELGAEVLAELALEVRVLQQLPQEALVALAAVANGDKSLK